MNLRYSTLWQLTTAVTRPESLAVLLEAQRAGSLEDVLEVASLMADQDEHITLMRGHVVHGWEVP